MANALYVTGTTKVGTTGFGTSDLMFSAGLVPFMGIADGSQYVTYHGVMNGVSNAMFSSPNCATVLTKIGASGLELTTETFVAAYKLVSSAGARTPASSLLLTLSDGFVYPISMSCSQNDYASISVGVIGIDGGATGGGNDTGNNCPFVKSTGSAGTDTGVTEMYTIGGLSVGGALLTVGIQSITVNFGISVTPIFGDGKTFPTEIFQGAWIPSVIVNGLNLDQFLGDLDGQEADVIVYFRKKLSGGKSDDNDSETAIKFTLNDALILSSDAAGDVAGLAAGGYLISGKNDGSNAPLIYAAASAITA